MVDSSSKNVHVKHVQFSRPTRGHRETLLMTLDSWLSWSSTLPRALLDGTAQPLKNMKSLSVREFKDMQRRATRVVPQDRMESCAYIDTNVVR